MSEPLYNRSKAVAALNRIDGFEPMELARVIENEGMEPQLYLDVKFRKLWFRLCNPTGKISKKIISLNENMAIVEAKVYLDKDDQPDSYVACALSQKFRTADPKFGDKFLETAETAATGRALADAGYGIQFIEGEENDSNLALEERDLNPVDAGIPIPQGNPRFENQNMPQGAQLQNYYTNTGYQSAPQTVYRTAPPNTGATYPQGQTEGKQAQAPLDARKPVDELIRLLNFEQAKAVVIDGNGVNSGKTMGQLAIENPGSLQWYVNNYKGRNNLLRAAARVLLEQAA